MINDNEAVVEMMLADLPQSDSDASRSERVRARCHKVLAHRRPAMILAERRPRRLQRAFEAVMVGGFCVVYLSAVTILALQTRGLM